MTEFEKTQRRQSRQLMVFKAGVTIRDHLGGSGSSTEDKLEHIRVAALGAVCDARAVMFALRAKGIITEREEQDYLDQGYKSVLDQITTTIAGLIQEVGHG